MTNKLETLQQGDLRVWHIPQIPGKAFEVDVASPEEAVKVMRILAEYDLFQYKNRIKPDYANAQGLREFDGKEWSEWYSDDGDDIDTWAENNGLS